MIKTLKIQGFKSLLSTEIELGAVNVFIGANGSGKSNLLESLGMLSAAVFGKVESETLRYRGVRPDRPKSFFASFKDPSSRDILLAIGDDTAGRDEKFDYSLKLRLSEAEEFAVSQEKASTRIESRGYELEFIREEEWLDAFSNGRPIKRIKIEKDWNFFPFVSILSATYPAIYEEVNALGGGPLMKVTGLLVKQISELSGYAIYSPSTPSLRGLLDDVSRDPLGLGGSGLARAVDELIDKSTGNLGPFDLDDVYQLIEWAEDISTNDPSPSKLGRSEASDLVFRDRFMRSDHPGISMREASEGSLYVLFLLTLVGHPRAPKIFAVDNFDQALHPRLACEVTRRISEEIVREGSRQMLATTHNPLVLDGLNLLDDRIRLFAVDRDAKGYTQVKRVEVTEDVMEQADKGFGLSRLWVMGRLGGVPASL